MALNAPAVAAESPWRVVAVYDGDTIVMARADALPVKIRLADIDAPEHDQPAGAEATAALKKLLAACPDDIHFLPQDIDHYGRTVAVIMACGRNVNAAMVSEGWAWVYTRYNKDAALPALEAAARAAKRGLWADPAPVNPETWRHAQPRKKYRP